MGNKDSFYNTARKGHRKKEVYRQASHMWAIMSFVLAAYFGFLGKNVYAGVIMFVFLVFIPSIVKFARNKIKENSYKHSSIYQVDMLSGHDFEDFLCANLKRLGYRVENVGAGGNDYGVDLIIKKNGKKTAVQAKRYKGRVGIEAVQQIVAGAEYYGCKNKMVITNSYYTQAAKNLAKKCNVILWDRDDCKKRLVTVKKEND